MNKTYTFICDCGYSEMQQMSKIEAAKRARAHLKSDEGCQEVYIDEYDECEGELSGIYYKVKK